MPSIPVPESEYIEKYGKLPDKDEIAELRATYNAKFGPRGFDLDDEWGTYWRNSDRTIDLLERLYIWWAAVRSGVERPQARAGSDN